MKTLEFTRRLPCGAARIRQPRNTPGRRLLLCLLVLVCRGAASAQNIAVPQPQFFAEKASTRQSSATKRQNLTINLWKEQWLEQDGGSGFGRNGEAGDWGIFDFREAIAKLPMS